jgi:hypothetical protein
MERFILDEMKGILVPEKEFHNGDWLDRLPEMLIENQLQPTGPKGAVQAAKEILDYC